MNLRRLLRLGPSIVHAAREGSLLLPRHVADHGIANWPKCARCLKAVSRYGIENDTPDRVEVWAECDGVQPDGLEPRKHARIRAGFTIDKRAYRSGWTPNTLTDVLRRMALEPGANGHWALKCGHPDVVVPS